MGFLIGKLSENQAKKLCSWEYPSEYSIYNAPPWEIIIKQKWGLANEQTREKEFYSILDEVGELQGFFRLVESGDNLTIGVGMKPEMCGCGHSSKIMSLILSCAKKEHPEKHICLYVREFNKRAIRCYEKAGFKITSRFFKKAETGSGYFLSMRYENNKNSFC